MKVSKNNKVMILDSSYNKEFIKNQIMRRNLNSVSDLKFLSDPEELSEAIPVEWQVKESDTINSVIERIWGAQNMHFPKHAAFLTNNLIAMVLGRFRGNIALGYYVKDVRSLENDGSQEVVYWGDLPCSQESIHSFEKSVGKIPNQLKAIWGIHSSLIMHSDNILVGPENPHFSKLGFGPEVLGNRESSEEPMQCECLSIINVWSAESYCLQRIDHCNPWEFPIVLAERFGNNWHPPSIADLDDFLVDGLDLNNNH